MAQAQVWHRHTLTFESPKTLSETASTFTDYRLNVTFKHTETGRTMEVPGFFAADGNAANTNASSGKVWKVHFNPPLEGEWTYEVSMRAGKNVAIKDAHGAGDGVWFDGKRGKFDAAPASTDPADGEFRTKGMITQEEGSHYLTHEGDGSVFIRAGAGSPENLLAYEDFDGTWDAQGSFLHDYKPHQRDFNAGDPTWDGGKGSEIIGAMNYLAENGMNSMYFMALTYKGDGWDVWPWTHPEAQLSYDVSKLEQWEILFEYMDDLGIELQMFTQETENDELLNNGAMGLEREVYYRELIARFSHHNGLTWNIGEENDTSPLFRETGSQFFEENDPYGHLVAVHTYPWDKNKVYKDLLGYEPFDGASLQSNTPKVRGDTERWIERSADAGDPWVVTWDESGVAHTGVQVDGHPEADGNHARHRDALWGHLTAGGSGSSWYFGYWTGETDTTMNDYRSRDSVWEWTVAARDFFAALPVEDMKQADDLTPSDNDYVFADPGEVYVIYLREGGKARLNLNGEPGTYSVRWYDPRDGEFEGSKTTVKGGSMVDLGNPPREAGREWAVLVERENGDSNVGDSNVGGGKPDPVQNAEDPDITLWLADARTDKLIETIEDGETLRLSAAERKNLALVAEVSGEGSGATESVRLSLDGPVSEVQTENVAPYAVFGDSNGDLHGSGLALGDYTLLAEAFTGNSAKGKKIASLDLDFAIAAPGGGAKDVATFALFDVRTDKLIATIEDGDTVDFADIKGRKLTVVATPDKSFADDVARAKITMDEYSRTDDDGPFSLFYDRDGDLKAGKVLRRGEYDVELDLYKTNKNGSLFAEEDLTFTIV